MAFLTIGIQPSIDRVARKLVELSGDNTAVRAVLRSRSCAGSMNSGA